MKPSVEQGRLAGLTRALCAGVLKSAIVAYRLTLSPLLGPTCRFAPSCSAYALEAIDQHGPWHGARLTVSRVLRCHPFHPGGFDPVPAIEYRMESQLGCPAGKDRTPRLLDASHAANRAGGSMTAGAEG